MAFNNQATVTKNQFIASLNSRKSDKVTCWVNLVDSFVISVFPGAKTIKDITAEQVRTKLSEYYGNDRVYLEVRDTTAIAETITPEEY